MTLRELLEQHEVIVDDNVIYVEFATEPKFVAVHPSWNLRCDEAGNVIIGSDE